MTIGAVGAVLFFTGIGIILYRVLGWNAVAVLLVCVGALLVAVQASENGAL